MTGEENSAKKFDSAKLLKRLVSGLILAVIALAADFYLPAFTVLCVVIAVLAFYEWYSMVNDGAHVKKLSLYAILTLLLSFYVTWHFSLLMGVFSLIVLGGTPLIFLTMQKGLKKALILTFGIFYIALPLNALLWLRSEHELGAYVILLVFLVTWLSDVFAYFFGKAIGGAKLAPVLSPNKTWAGLFGACVGGLVGGYIVLTSLNIIRPNWHNYDLAYLHIFNMPEIIFAGFCFLMGVVGQLGDLGESALKRHYGCKDSGAVIPGHGGVLDRVDALLVISLVVALTQLILMNFFQYSLDGSFL